MCLFSSFLKGQKVLPESIAQDTVKRTDTINNFKYFKSLTGICV